MQLLLLTASLALVLTVRCAPRSQDGDQWTEFNGFLGDKVANYTCIPKRAAPSRRYLGWQVGAYKLGPVFLEAATAPTTG